MPVVTALLPEMLQAIDKTIETHADAVTELDQAIGDGDHVTNLQRGIKALLTQSESLSTLPWLDAWQKIGMILMTKVGGASGSLYGTLFVAMSKAGRDRLTNEQPPDQADFAAIFFHGVEAVKQRGKSDAGEKTLLDVLIPVAKFLQLAADSRLTWPEVSQGIKQTAIEGMESTRDMLATKGRASFLEERSRGHIDAGAKTSQLMICSLVDVLNNQP